MYQRRLVLEREIGKDSLYSKEVVDLTEVAGLMKNITDFGKCSKVLIKEFIVNIPKECDNIMSKEYKRIFDRGKCVKMTQR